MARKLEILKRKKHDKIVRDYDEVKSKHLEKLANRMLRI